VQTSFNWSFGLVPGSTYSFYVYAVDGSGNKSQKSNTVTVTPPLDTTPPTAPVLTLVDINPTEAAFEWTASTDDGPHLMYQVYVNGIANVDAGTSRSAVVHNLTPATTYVFTVRARDFYGGNVSAPSNEITATTDALDPNDTEAPLPPGNLSVQDMGCAEAWLSWTESIDNQTPQSAIAYEVYVNGAFDHTIIGADRTITYGTINGENTFTLIAIDSAGNRSEPASFVIVMLPC
jgi:chitinase